MRAGSFKHPNFGEVEVTEGDLENAVKNFAAWKESGVQVPIDYDHSFRTKGDSKAAGWMDSLELTGDKLLAKVKWTKEAADSIRSGAYRFFSPEFASDFKDEEGNGKGFTVVSGGLTNRPFLKGMTPVALSEEVREVAQDWMNDLAETVGLSSYDNQSMAEKEETTETKDSGPQPPKAPGGEGEPGTREPDAKTEEKTVTLSEADFSTMNAAAEQVKTFQERLVRTEKALSDEKFTRIFSQAQREGRVDAKDETRTKWRERVDKFGLEEVETLLYDLPAETIPVKERGSSSSPEPALEGDGELEREQLDQRIKSRMKAESITYMEAFDAELQEQMT
jgi:phage I-like protein